MAAESKVCDFGWKAPAFELPSTAGETVTLQSAAGPNGLLVMFICNHCPFVKSITDKLVRDGRDLQALGVGVVAVCSNDAVAYPDDSFDKMKLFASENGFPFPYLHDADQTVARAYDAQCTPDFFGFNAGLELQYRGRLDSSGRHGGDAPRELYEAMRRVAETGAGPESQVPSIGCSIKWRAA